MDWYTFGFKTTDQHWIVSRNNFKRLKYNLEQSSSHRGSKDNNKSAQITHFGENWVVTITFIELKPLKVFHF